MNLTQLVAFFFNKDLKVTAMYFAGCINDSVVVNGLIESDFVKRHVGDGHMWREITSNVTTYIGCEK
jgi:hypothetical protein